eukprot:TRINITY_DN248_c0_g3_i4.p1 TRINITY_DN248_c0_g3~~TRINITY_DN248_c0_g3_i4.p1  ORF type:complete len:282 (+),score=87.41 TRINITY_DN248_c0_g3_i4:652-1497(+)
MNCASTESNPKLQTNNHFPTLDCPTMELNDSRESRGSSNYEEGDSFESEHWRNDSFENDYGPQDDDEEADQVMNMMRNTKVREKEDLMDAFLEVVGGDDDNAAEFFLEANNWNLDGAIAAFFEEMKRGGLASSRELSKNNNSKQNHHNRGDDIEMDGGENNINNNNASAHKVRISTKGGSFIYDEEGDNSLKAELVDEFDLEEGANVRPGEEITKTWRIGNSSVRPWPPQCALVSRSSFTSITFQPSNPYPFHQTFSEKNSVVKMCSFSVLARLPFFIPDY